MAGSQKAIDMADKNSNEEWGKIAASLHPVQQKEHILAAIVLLLGSDTAYQKRLQASQRLAKMGPDVLPLLLQTLHLSPEITPSSWPWRPLQYEHVSRLLIHLSQQAHLSLTELLSSGSLTGPPGPVLWTSVIEAAGLLLNEEYEPLLREGLEAPWWTVRYAAATAIARRIAHKSLYPATRQALYYHQATDPEIPVRLAASCALLRCGDSRSLETLLPLLEPAATREVRQAAIFILATELPISLKPEQRQHLASAFLRLLQDTDQRVSFHAARALRNVASAATLPALKTLLDHPSVHVCLAALTAFEELASRKTMRYAMQQQLIPQQIAPLLHRPEQEIRRQACYTLATLNGIYATTILGTIILDDAHPAHLEAIEALRLLPDIQRPALLEQILRWLLHAMAQPLEMVQICALDSLSYLICQARRQHRHEILLTISEQLQQSGCIFQLLASTSAWVRQRAVELLSMLDLQLYHYRAILLEMLHRDIDSGVRACLASTLGHNSALWALPDLIQATLDSDDYVAETALNALGTLPLLDDALLIYVFKELAAYRLPIWTLCERKPLAQAARAWLKKRGRVYH